MCWVGSCARQTPALLLPIPFPNPRLEYGLLMKRWAFLFGLYVKRRYLGVLSLYTKKSCCSDSSWLKPFGVSPRSYTFSSTPEIVSTLVPRHGVRVDCSMLEHPTSRMLNIVRVGGVVGRHCVERFPSGTKRVQKFVRCQAVG